MPLSENVRRLTYTFCKCRPEPYRGKQFSSHLKKEGDHESKTVVRACLACLHWIPTSAPDEELSRFVDKHDACKSCKVSAPRSKEFFAGVILELTHPTRAAQSREVREATMALMEQLSASEEEEEEEEEDGLSLPSFCPAPTQDGQEALEWLSMAAQEATPFHHPSPCEFPASPPPPPPSLPRPGEPIPAHMAVGLSNSALKDKVSRLQAELRRAQEEAEKRNSRQEALRRLEADLALRENLVRSTEEVLQASEAALAKRLKDQEEKDVRVNKREVDVRRREEEVKKVASRLQRQQNALLHIPIRENKIWADPFQGSHCNPLDISACGHVKLSGGRVAGYFTISFNARPQTHRLHLPPEKRPRLS